jgi:ATP synthase protein I
MQNEEKNSIRKKIRHLSDSGYGKYSSLGVQMLVIILVGVVGGYKLDHWLHLAFPICTLVLSLASVSFAIYIAVKDLSKNN